MFKKNVINSVLLAVLVLMGGTVADAGSDVFSVNFYAYNGNPDPPENVTLEAGQSAGFDNWNTTGWENILMPWNPAGPLSNPVTITSVQGATATFNLVDVRNGGQSQTVAGVRTAPVGDGNGDLMDGAGWGTEDPGDQSKIFYMTVSDIPFATYDVILYLARRQGVDGDGTGGDEFFEGIVVELGKHLLLPNFRADDAGDFAAEFIIVERRVELKDRRLRKGLRFCFHFFRSRLIGAERDGEKEQGGCQERFFHAGFLHCAKGGHFAVERRL